MAGMTKAELGEEFERTRARLDESQRRYSKLLNSYGELQGRLEGLIREAAAAMGEARAYRVAFEQILELVGEEMRS